MGAFGRLLSGVRQRTVANMLGAPSTVPGLFFAFVVASVAAWCLMIFSWWFLALRSRLVRGYAMSTLWWVEIASACMAALGHFVLLYFAVYWQLPLALLCRCLRVRRRRPTPASSVTRRAQGSRDVSGEESPSVGAEWAEEAEMRARGTPATVAVTVGNTGGLQQRSNSRGAATASSASADVRATLLSGAAAAAAAPARCSSFGSRAVQERLARSFPAVMCAVCCAICLIHYVIHRTIPDAHRQSQEILLGLIRVCLDVVLLTACEIFVALRLENIAAHANQSSSSGSSNISSSSGGGARVSYVRVVLYLCGAVFLTGTVYTLTRFLWLLFSVDTIQHLNMGVIWPCDICAAEGMKINPAMAKSWVWPALTHRRLFNFWTGSEKCAHASGLPPISFLSADDNLLLVSPVCHDGSRPRVYLHRPENSEFNGSPDVNLPETQRGNLEYHRQLEAIYGTASAADGSYAFINRDPSTRLILSVEVNPSRLVAEPREPQSARERAARRQWPDGGRKVLSVPLGMTAAYTVHCEALDHEEYHMYPLADVALDAFSRGVDGVREAKCIPWWKRAGHHQPPPSPPGGQQEPAGNVMIMLLDAVSRQEVRRSLPKLSRELSKFAISNPRGHLVLEAEAAMTLGINTAANLVPFFAGITANAVGLPTEVKFSDISFMPNAVFVKAKEKYGDMISTAMTSAFCHDLLEYLMGYTDPSSGAGGRVMGIDRYTYAPFCHLDYSGVHSNFRGPYSIVRRCMAGEAVWDHMVNYTEAVLERQLKGSRRALNASARVPISDDDCDATMPDGNYGKFFFHVMYMTEGHEGTHGVIPLVDDSLTRFFVDLRDKQRFFDNPLNTFILLADHGNHMGHYNAYTNAGEFERGTPPTVMIVHRDVLDRVDRNKGRNPGAAVMNIFQRLKRVSTPMDIYLTLADLLNVPAQVYHTYNAAGVVHPASLFDERDAVSSGKARNCSQFSSTAEHYPCPLDFCQPV